MPYLYGKHHHVLWQHDHPAFLLPMVNLSKNDRENRLSPIYLIERSDKKRALMIFPLFFPSRLHQISSESLPGVPDLKGGESQSAIPLNFLLFQKPVTYQIVYLCDNPTSRQGMAFWKNAFD